MSMEYPCVYFEKNGRCRKFSDDTAVSYCVMGPCPEQKLSNADLVRTMSDEELAGYLAEISGGTVLKMAAQLGIPLDQEKNERYIDRLKEEYLKRLQQPAEEGE